MDPTTKKKSFVFALMSTLLAAVGDGEVPPYDRPAPTPPPSRKSAVCRRCGATKPEDERGTFKCSVCDANVARALREAEERRERRARKRAPKVAP